MSSPARRCSGCGFEPGPAAQYCERCGAALHSSPDRVVPDPDHSSLGDPEERFRALRAHPEFPALLSATPAIPELGGQMLPSLLLLLGLTVLGALASLVAFQLCPPLGFVPLVVVLLGAGTIVRQLWTGARTPLVAQPALVVELRARIQTGAPHSHDHTRHFATLQLETGERREHECYASARVGLQAGSIGVAYLKGERLAGFTPVPV